MAGTKHGRGAEQVSLRLPDGLRDRIKAYADRHGRSMNAEIVRILEREFPAPISLDEQVEELLGLISALKEADPQEGLARLNEALLEAVDRISLGHVKGVSEEDQIRVRSRFEEWRDGSAEERYHRQTADMDDEEVEALSRGDSTAKFIKSSEDLDQDPGLAEIAKYLADGDVDGAINAMGIDPEQFEKFKSAMEQINSLRFSRKHDVE